MGQTGTTPRGTATGRLVVLLILLLIGMLALAGCGPAGGQGPGRTGSPATTSPPARPVPSITPAPAVSTATSLSPHPGATPPPSWLGQRILTAGPNGFAAAQETPPELRDRRIITTDVLAPPSDGLFHSRIQAVPAAVARRSTWSSGCPVSLASLRYVTVTFAGFDGRAHTGELLVNRRVAGDVVTVFRRLFAAGWPIEQMTITRPAELTAPPTGDGNNTSAFVCRPVRGYTTRWSQHAYGLAIDLDPFQNPSVGGSTVLPELATAYTVRRGRWPGTITAHSVPVQAFAAAGWGWGGSYSSKKDWMHFSSTGT